MIDELGKPLLPGNRLRNAYVLDSIKITEDHICLTSVLDDSWVWNKKLGHANMRLIEKLAKHKLATGLPKLVYKNTNIYRSTW